MSHHSKIFSSYHMCFIRLYTHYQYPFASYFNCSMFMSSIIGALELRLLFIISSTTFVTFYSSCSVLLSCSFTSWFSLSVKNWKCPIHLFLICTSPQVILSFSFFSWIGFQVLPYLSNLSESPFEFYFVCMFISFLQCFIHITIILKSTIHIIRLFFIAPFDFCCLVL